MSKLFSLIIAIMLFGCMSCNQQVKIAKTSFGKVDEKEVFLYSITIKDGLDAKLTNYGGIITSLSVVDKNGLKEDVVLGFDSLKQYQEESPYFGALIGRYGNRIADGEFSLDGKTYNLTKNSNGNHLHGGVKGFDKVVWEVLSAEVDDASAKIKLKYVSVEGEEGFPGTLTTIVNYIFTKDELKITYEATTDQSTIVNLTQHTYFNLAGEAKEDILSHELKLSASQMVAVDDFLIPTGELNFVDGTPFDFRKSKKISRDIDEDNLQLTNGMGYDHCLVLDGGQSQESREIGELYHPASGRLMKIFTTEPAIQVYSGNFLDGSLKGKGGKAYDYRYGLCLETQHFPDSPNQPSFPSVVLDPEQTYYTETSYKFSVK